jgi:DNA-binding response OmpR family regulator
VADRPIEVYEFGEFRLDVGEGRLERREGRQRIAIPEKAFQTLVHLVRNSGALVTRMQSCRRCGQAPSSKTGTLAR